MHVGIIGCGLIGQKRARVLGETNIAVFNSDVETNLDSEEQAA